MGVLPSHYSIHLEPDLEHFGFTGNVEISVTVDEEIDRIELDALDLEVAKCKVNNKEVKHELSLERQKLILFLDGKTKGNLKLEIDYKGEINDKLVGLYRSKFISEGKEKFVAVTQFQENDARRAFPCFDEPGKKATFDIEYVVDKDLFCISNTSIIEEKDLGNGKKLVKFERTPIMSTYLVFFGIGEFEAIEAESRGRPIRLIASPGNASKYGQFGLDFGIKSLEYCEDWFGIPYPISKLDFIGTAAFAHGAMENWGAILFRENLLLHYPGITSKMQELRIEEVIAHEVVHQWFGNLVSPVSWKYLWLNESFATFFSFLVVDHYYPHKRVWEFFVASETAPALNADGRHATLPIEVPEDTGQGMTIKNVNILYNKGGSVLRQMMAYLGEESFQKGLRHYLDKFKYSVASSGDLWRSIQEASGKPVVDLMESWVLQPGYPVVSVKRNGNTLLFSQRRFTFLPNDSEQVWMVPISVKVFKGEKGIEKSFMLTDREGSLDLGEEFDAFKVNMDSTGFYRVQYEKTEWELLGELIRKKQISATDRWSLEEDMYGFLRSRDITLEEYLGFLSFYDQEDHAMPLKNIAGHLSTLFEFFDDGRREKVAVQGKKILEQAIEKIGFDPVDGEDLAVSMARPDILWAAVRLGSETISSRAMELFNKLKEGENISADLLATILKVGALKTNDFDWFAEKLRSAQNEQEIVNYGAAITQVSNPELIPKVEEFIFEEIPYRNRGGAIALLASNPVAKETLWEWYLANLDNFEKLHPFMYQIALVSIISRSVDKENDVKEFFNGYLKKNPSIADAIEVGLENLEMIKHLTRQ
ncbi:MAG: M1 family peptidase [Methanobacteriota archaeon]|nr:MAG: M1 family peptidase [Euryarchaeota archaeon]